MSDNTELYNMAVYNSATYAQVNSANVIYVGISFIMLIINQNLHLEIAIQKFGKIIS